MEDTLTEAVATEEATQETSTEAPQEGLTNEAVNTDEVLQNLANAPAVEPKTEEEKLKFKIGGEEKEFTLTDIQKQLAAGQGFNELEKAKQELALSQENLNAQVQEKLQAEKEQLLSQIRESLPELIEEKAKNLIQLQSMPEHERALHEKDRAFDELKENLGNMTKTYEQTLAENRQVHLERNVEAFLTQANVTNPTVKDLFTNSLVHIQQKGNDISPNNLDYNKLLEETKAYYHKDTVSRIQALEPAELVEALGEQGLQALAQAYTSKKAESKPIVSKNQKTEESVDKNGDFII